MALPIYASNTNSFFERGLLTFQGTGSGWYIVEHAAKGSEDVTVVSERILEYDSETMFTEYRADYNADDSWSNIFSGTSTSVSLLEGRIKAAPVNSYIMAVDATTLDELRARWV